MPVVQATIAPIEAKNLRIDRLVPIPAPEGVHVPEIVSHSPLVMSQRTIDHARECAKKAVERMANLPHSVEAGDLLAMAYTILHFTGKSEP